jgi:hypothetical protein
VNPSVQGGDGEKPVRRSVRAHAFALGRSELHVAQRGLGAHQVVRRIAVRAAVGEKVHQLVRQRLRQIARAVRHPHRVGELRTGGRVRAADRLGVERRIVERIVDEEDRRLAHRQAAQQLARHRRGIDLEAARRLHHAQLDPGQSYAALREQSS